MENKVTEGTTSATRHETTITKIGGLITVER